MTERRLPKRRRLAYEILGLIGVSALIAALLFWILSWSAAAIVNSYCYEKDLILTEFDWLEVDRWIFSLSSILSAGGFSLLFLILLNDRITYIRTLTAGIDALRMGQTDCAIPLEGKNELAQLADAINHMSATQQLLREKEQALAREKEQFIRTLSHDIRTPLTAILSYSEYLSEGNSLTVEEQQMYLQTIRKKAEQIRDLTALLLDAGKRHPEYFSDARLLMEQLAAEFEEELEERFTVLTDLSGCRSFAGAFDVQELRRMIDNLSSNVQKYADSQNPVQLRIYADSAGLRIEQSNQIAAESRQADSYRLGIHSIRRIAQSYGGKVDIQKNADNFRIVITLSDF